MVDKRIENLKIFYKLNPHGTFLKVDGEYQKVNRSIELNIDRFCISVYFKFWFGKSFLKVEYSKIPDDLITHVTCVKENQEVCWSKTAIKENVYTKNNNDLHPTDEIVENVEFIKEKETDLQMMSPTPVEDIEYIDFNILKQSLQNGEYFVYAGCRDYNTPLEDLNVALSNSNDHIIGIYRNLSENGIMIDQKDYYKLRNHRLGNISFCIFDMSEGKAYSYYEKRNAIIEHIEREGKELSKKEKEEIQIQCYQNKLEIKNGIFKGEKIVRFENLLLIPYPIDTYWFNQ